MNDKKQPTTPDRVVAYYNIRRLDNRFRVALEVTPHNIYTSVDSLGPDGIWMMVKGTSTGYGTNGKTRASAAALKLVNTFDPKEYLP